MKFKYTLGIAVLLLILVIGCSRISIQSPIKIEKPISREEAKQIAEDFINAVVEYPGFVKPVNVYLENDYWKVGIINQYQETGIIYVNAKTGKVEYIEENGVKITADSFLKNLGSK